MLVLLRLPLVLAVDSMLSLWLLAVRALPLRLGEYSSTALVRRCLSAEVELDMLDMWW